jgi:hypothetical protein
MYEYLGFSFTIHFDPVRELFFSGIPGYMVPTIYVGTTEEEVRESVEYFLENPVDFHTGEGHIDEHEIAYDIEEAYCSGWVIREPGSESRRLGKESQRNRHIENEKINVILESIKEIKSEEFDTLHEQWGELEQELADHEEERQKSRMRLIEMAMETGHSLCLGDGVDIMRVQRLGLNA